MTLDAIAGLYNYWIVIFLMMTGFYIVLARKNLIKMVIGLNIFQTSVFLLYITMGKVSGGTAPIIPPKVAHSQAEKLMHAARGDVERALAGNATEHAEVIANAVSSEGTIVYSNPLPSVLMLTAIVVGIATTALALALVVRIREDYGTVDEEKILELDRVE